MKKSYLLANHAKRGCNVGSIMTTVNQMQCIPNNVFAFYLHDELVPNTNLLVFSTTQEFFVSKTRHHSFAIVKAFDTA